MRWWPTAVLAAFLLGALAIWFPLPAQAQAGPEVVTIPVSGMT